MAAGWAKTETETYVFGGNQKGNSYVPNESKNNKTEQKARVPPKPPGGATACTMVANYPLEYRRPLKFECELWSEKGKHMALGKFESAKGGQGWNFTSLTGDSENRVAIMRKDIELRYDSNEGKGHVYGLGKKERVASCWIHEGYCATANHVIIFEADEQFLPANSKLKFKDLPLCDPTKVEKYYKFKEAPDCSQFEKEEAAPIAAYVHTPKDTLRKVTGAVMCTVVENKVVNSVGSSNFFSNFVGSEPSISYTKYPPVFTPDKMNSHNCKFMWGLYKEIEKKAEDERLTISKESDNLFSLNEQVNSYENYLVAHPHNKMFWDNNVKVMRTDNTHERNGTVMEDTFKNTFVQRPKLIYYNKITGQVQSPQDVTLPTDCKIEDGYCRGSKFAFWWDPKEQEGLGTIKNFYNNETHQTMVSITVKDDEFDKEECKNEKYWINAENDCKIKQSIGYSDCTIKVNMCGNIIRGRVYFDDNTYSVIYEKDLKAGKADVYVNNAMREVTFKPPFFNYLKVREKQANISNVFDHTTNLFHRDFVNCTHAEQCKDKKKGWGYRDCFCTVDGSLIGIPKDATKNTFDILKKMKNLEESKKNAAHSKRRRRRGVEGSRRRRDASEDAEGRIRAALKVKIALFKLVFRLHFPLLILLFLLLPLQASAEATIL